MTITWKAEQTGCLVSRHALKHSYGSTLTWRHHWAWAPW